MGMGPSWALTKRCQGSASDFRMFSTVTGTGPSAGPDPLFGALGTSGKGVLCLWTPPSPVCGSALPLRLCIVVWVSGCWCLSQCVSVCVCESVSVTVCVCLCACVSIYASVGVQGTCRNGARRDTGPSLGQGEDTGGTTVGRVEVLPSVRANSLSVPAQTCVCVHMYTAQASVSPC